MMAASAMWYVIAEEGKTFTWSSKAPQFLWISTARTAIGQTQGEVQAFSSRVSIARSSSREGMAEFGRNHGSRRTAAKTSQPAFAKSACLV